MSLDEIVIHNISYYRKKLGISDKELSIAIGKKENYIENLEHKKYKKYLNVDVIDKIAEFLGIDVVLLFSKEKCANIEDRKVSSNDKC